MKKAWLEYAVTLEQLSLTFSVDIFGYSGGQTDGRVLAYLNGRPVGGIDFAEYDDEVFIKMIEVLPEFQRQGVGSALVHRLGEEFPGEPIKQFGGFATAPGQAFSQALGITQ